MNIIGTIALFWFSDSVAEGALVIDPKMPFFSIFFQRKKTGVFFGRFEFLQCFIICYSADRSIEGGTDFRNQIVFNECLIYGR